MYYSVIGIIAIVIHLIMNHEFIKIDKNRDEINRAFKRFALATLMYFITDVLWGVFDYIKMPVLLYLDTVIYYISIPLQIPPLLPRHLHWYILLLTIYWKNSP